MRVVEVDGRPVALHAAGGPDPAGRRVVVLLHGAGNDHTVWSTLPRLLATRGTAVAAVDLPGHGRSPGPPPADVPATGAWLHRLLDALGASRATVVGHSMGSLIALAAAAAEAAGAEAAEDGALPRRIDRIGLVCTSGRMQVHPALQTAADARDPRAIDMIVGWTHTGPARATAHAQAGLWTAGITRRLLEREIGGLGHDLRACQAFDGAAVAEALAGDVAAGRLRALVVSADRDRMTPARAGAAVAERLGAPHVVIPGGCHATPYDTPALLAAALAPLVDA